MKLSERGIIIRKTTEKDLREIYLLAGMPRPGKISVLNTSALAEMFMSPRYIMFSAVRKKRVLGFISGKIDSGKADIELIMVKPNFRNSGIGSALLSTFSEDAKKTGANNFFIAVYEHDVDSIKFLLNQGFSDSSRQLLLMKKQE